MLILASCCQIVQEIWTSSQVHLSSLKSILMYLVDREASSLINLSNKWLKDLWPSEHTQKKLFHSLKCQLYQELIFLVSKEENKPWLIWEIDLNLILMKSNATIISWALSKQHVTASELDGMTNSKNIVLEFGE